MALGCTLHCIQPRNTGVSPHFEGTSVYVYTREACSSRLFGICEWRNVIFDEQLKQRCPLVLVQNRHYVPSDHCILRKELDRKSSGQNKWNTGTKLVKLGQSEIFSLGRWRLGELKCFSNINFLVNEIQKSNFLCDRNRSKQVTKPSETDVIFSLFHRWRNISLGLLCGPVANTPGSQCKQAASDPWSGN